jgi:hypothetical protein
MGNFPINNYNSSFSQNRYGYPNSCADFNYTTMEIPIQTINNTYDYTLSMWVKIRNSSIKE